MPGNQSPMLWEFLELDLPSMNSDIGFTGSHSSTFALCKASNFNFFLKSINCTFSYSHLQFIGNSVKYDVDINYIISALKKFSVHMEI